MLLQQQQQQASVSLNNPQVLQSNVTNIYQTKLKDIINTIQNCKMLLKTAKFNYSSYEEIY